MPIIFTFFLLGFLFSLSQKITIYIYNSVFIITKNKNLAIGVLIFILLPGTFIHEISHFLIATVLRVPTSGLTVIPTIEKDGPSFAKASEGEKIKAGKLFLGETDPFRLSLIGLAPMIIGLTIIYLIGEFFIPSFSKLQTTNYKLPTILSFYLLFIISITIFSSKKDMKGVIIAVPIIFIILISLYAAGIRIFFDKSLLGKIDVLLSNLNYYLVITTIINLFVFLILYGNLYLWGKIFKLR